MKVAFYNVNNFLKNRLPDKWVLFLLFAISISVLAFHLFVLFGVIPYNIVWGGRLETYQSMLVMEAVSISVNLYFLFICFLRYRSIRSGEISNLVRFSFWAFAILFFVNTIGNLAAETNLETQIFTPLTLLLSVLSYRLALK